MINWQKTSIPVLLLTGPRMSHIAKQKVDWLNLWPQKLSAWLPLHAQLPHRLPHLSHLGKSRAMTALHPTCKVTPTMWPSPSVDSMKKMRWQNGKLPFLVLQKRARDVMGSPGCSGQCLEGLEHSGHSLGCPGCLGHSLEHFWLCLWQGTVRTMPHVFFLCCG